MKPPTRLCAVYTRKSTDERLDMEFNSLDAQREGCLAYIASQKSEGWVPVKKSYDDGGFSGGSMERPALRQLLEDIKAGLVNTVVVYKIDRLTRSLMDFAKLVEVFDAHSVTFVSITQSFNTTTSMGRLTLNVLLSFAQFEREVAGERIRDKIAASKRKGMWMGGQVPFGYITTGRSLAIQPNEAKIVLHIFDRYLALGNARTLAEELQSEGYRNRPPKDRNGKNSDGSIFSRGALYNILSNPTYTGRIRHKDVTYDGQHEAIISEDIWKKVQALLKSQAATSKGQKNSREINLLKGLLFDEDGTPYSPSYTSKGKRQYRYYLSQNLLQHRDHPKGIPARLPAQDLERVIEAAIRKPLQNINRLAELLEIEVDSSNELLRHVAANQRSMAAIDLIKSAVRRVIIGEKTLAIELNRTGLVGILCEKLRIKIKADDLKQTLIQVPFESLRGRKGSLLIESDAAQRDIFDQPPEALKKLVQGFIWRDQHFNGMTIEKIASREKLTAPYTGQVILKTLR